MSLNRVVYDCIDPSPFYEGTNEPYIDENDLIEISGSEDYRKYNFGPMNSNTYQANINNKGLKINRFYHKLNHYYIKQDEQDTTLVFESRFESGNLRRAVQISEFEYELILKYDYMTNNYTQWFYFKVANTKKDVTYKFNIINLIKSESSYKQGMRPLIYSTKEAAQEGGLGWQRDGQNIAYY